MVDKKASAYPGTRVNLNTSQEAADMGNKPSRETEAMLPQEVSQTVGP
jgi:hypothetical protein